MEKKLFHLCFPSLCHQSINKKYIDPFIGINVTLAPLSKLMYLNLLINFSSPAQTTFLLLTFRGIGAASSAILGVACATLAPCETFHAFAS